SPQSLQVRHPGIAEHRCFAVDDPIAIRQNLRGACNLAELLGPVVAAARIDGDAAGTHMQLCPVSVDFDFVQPVETFAAYSRKVGSQGSMKPGKGVRRAPGMATVERLLDERLNATAHMRIQAGRGTLVPWVLSTTRP